MADMNKQMAEFARELWENYIKPKFNAEFSDNVTYYMATVVSNDGNNKVTIKRPFDDAYQVSCLEDMAGLVAGDTVLVLHFGNGTNNANHIIFGRGNGNTNYTAVGATETANEATASAARAARAADDAQQSADDAQESAEIANRAANNALIGLSTVEGVVDTVNWFADHKKASTDTTVQPNKTYYEYNETTETLTAVTPEGDENPSQEGWYELDEAISNYVASHVATTNDGLYVVGESNGWRILVSSGTGTFTPGVFLIDSSGNIAQATTASGIRFNEGKPFYIGDDDASIIFDGNGHIAISGNGVTIGGSKTISEVLAELGASITAIEYGVGTSPTSHSDITSWSSASPEWQVGKYIWQRTSTNGLTYTYACIQGATPYSYSLNLSNVAVFKTPSGTYNPTTITLSASQTQGGGSPSSYSGRFKVETYDGSTWTQRYPTSGSGTDQSSYAYMIPTNITITQIRCSLYLAGGALTDDRLLDQQSIPVITDSGSGNPGEDAYTVILTNENHTFAGSTTAAIGGSTECYVVTYKGAAQVGATIGTITGQPTGMTTSISGNGSTSAKFTVTVTTSMTSRNGVLTVPVTVDGKTFQMKFTYSLALNGQAGEDGKMLYATSGTGAGTTAKVATLTSGTLTLVTGATVAVTFVNANTAANATLNISGTGAKTIRAAGSNLTATSAYNWTAGATVTFVYDGTYWQMDGTASLSKANSAQSTANTAQTAASNAATAASNAQSTANTAQTTASNAATAAATAQTTADNAQTAATNAAKTATNYITNIGSNGITVTGNSATANVQISNKVRVQADSTHFTDVESTGMKVYSGSASVPVAQFLASSSKIGSDSTHYTEFTSNSLTIAGGTDSPTVSLSTYPVTSSQASTSTGELRITNAARTKTLVAVGASKRTTPNGEFPFVTIYDPDDGSVAATMGIGFRSGTTIGGRISVSPHGYSAASAALACDTTNGGALELYHPTNSSGGTAQAVAFNRNQLTFFPLNSSGTPFTASWYGARKAYIKGAYDEGAVVHGHTSTYEMSLDCDLSSGYVAFYGNGTAIGAIPVGSSDRRTKTDIEPVTDKYKRAVAKVELKDFRYNFTDDVLSGVNDLRRFGVIAQDVIEALEAEGIQEDESELVRTLGEGDSGRYIVNYVPFLIARIAADEDRIQKLEEQNKALEERLSVLEDIMLKNLIRDIDET